LGVAGRGRWRPRLPIVAAVLMAAFDDAGVLSAAALSFVVLSIA
jgi:hypothetical protein